MREMRIHGRLAEPNGLGIRVGNEYVTLHADRRTSGKGSHGLRRAAALFECDFVGVDIGSRRRHRPQSDEMQALFASEGRADLVRGAVPEWRVRLLQRPQ